MAQVASPPLPPTPPPPIYSPPLRANSPQIMEPLEEKGIVQQPPAYQQENQEPKNMSHPTISMSPADGGSGEEAIEVTEVQISPPEPALSKPSDAAAPEGTLTPEPSLRQDPARLSPGPQTIRQLGEPQTEINHRRVSSENLNPQGGPELTPFQKRSVRHVSTSAVDMESPSESFEPLRYHHQSLEDPEMRTLNRRASRLTVATDMSGPADSSRNSTYGLNLRRPDSAFSSTSEFRGRTYSPSLSPARPVSRGSRSPDTRPLSYVDLLNVPYPQPPPSGAENLVNSGLRSVVGNNANLLSTRKTLEMYRANVKKTNDPAVQYEFAIFMISAAQEEGLEQEGDAASAVSGKSHASVRDDLLKEAKHILQRLADRSYPFAQYYLADGYASGLFNKGKEDWDRAFPLFLAASKHGHAEAMYRTALCYEFGWGCRVDAAKAVQFYQHAASKNHPGAMLRLGRACLTGDMGLTKRYREGVRWLKRAAEAADFQYNQAPYDLGCLHETGYGPDVFKDEAYAAQLYTKAADLGHVDANFRLGRAYEFGELNCPKDPALSIHFYTGAAERGHPESQLALCAWYMVGVPGVLEKDEAEAYEWAKKAAEQGLAKAQYTVGYFTEMGIGCRRDPLEANVWYVRAADQGEERAKHRIAAIRAAGAGADPVTAATAKKGLLTSSKSSGNKGPQEGEKKKKFGIF